MSDIKRASIPGEWFYASNSGANHRLLFYNNNHRRAFLGLLSEISELHSIEIHAYCLMDNHYQLLVKATEKRLTGAVDYLDRKYASYLNSNTGRSGLVFTEKDKTIQLENASIMQISREIHQTPARTTGLFKAEYYKWSSYQAYIGIVTAPRWLRRDLILSHFPQKLAYKKYNNYVEAPVATSIK